MEKKKYGYVSISAPLKQKIDILKARYGYSTYDEMFTDVLEMLKDYEESIKNE